LERAINIYGYSAGPLLGIPDVIAIKIRIYVQEAEVCQPYQNQSDRVPSPNRKLSEEIRKAKALLETRSLLSIYRVVFNTKTAYQSKIASIRERHNHSRFTRYP